MYKLIPGDNKPNIGDQPEKFKDGKPIIDYVKTLIEKPNDIDDLIKLIECEALSKLYKSSAEFS